MPFLRRLHRRETKGGPRPRPTDFPSPAVEWNAEPNVPALASNPYVEASTQEAPPGTP